MSLFKKNKKFEDQLKGQLGDMEYKPSESLWNRIDTNIPDDGFETQLKHSMENFEQVPYSDTWSKIAAELPEGRSNNTALKYYGLALLVLLFALGIYVDNSLQSHSNNEKQLSQINSTNNSIEQTNGVGTSLIRVGKRTVQENTKIKESLSNSNLHNRFTSNRNSYYKTKDLVQSNQQPLELRAGGIKEDVLYNESTIQVANLINTPIESSHSKELIVATIEPQSISDSNTSKMVLNIDTPEIAAKPVAAREVEEYKPDSFLVVQKMATINSTPNQDDLTRFSISVLAGAYMCYSTYASPENSTLYFNENIALRKQLERPDIDWSGGFLVDYKIGKRLMISTGIMMVNFNQKFDYSTTKAIDIVNPAEVGVAVSNPNDSIVSGNLYSNRIKYAWTEIPILFNYTFLKVKRWNFDLQAGASYAFINTVDGGMISYDNKGVLVLNDKNDFPKISNTIFVSIMPQVSYSFGQDVSIGLVPTFKYGALSIIGNNNWVQQHPYFIGLNMCLRKQF